MFNWFSKKPPVCPIDDETRHWVDRRWDWLLTEFGLERLKKVEQILPKPQYFPDPYNGTEEDAQRMFERVCHYLQLDPATMELHLYNEQKIAGVDNWKGTAGVYHEEDGKFHIWLEVSNLELPLALVATIAHELCHVFLLGQGRVNPDEDEDHEQLTDLLTVYMGFGVITANAVVFEQNWTLGNMSGWRMKRSGYLDMRTFGYALAKFAISRNEQNVAWLKVMRPDVRHAFQESLRILQSET